MFEGWTQENHQIVSPQKKLQTSNHPLSPPGAGGEARQSGSEHSVRLGLLVPAGARLESLVGPVIWNCLEYDLIDYYIDVYTVTTFKYVEGGQDCEAPEVVWNTSSYI